MYFEIFAKLKGQREIYEQVQTLIESKDKAKAIVEEKEEGEEEVISEGDDDDDMPVEVPMVSLRN